MNLIFFGPVVISKTPIMVKTLPKLAVESPRTCPSNIRKAARTTTIPITNAYTFSVRFKVFH